MLPLFPLLFLFQGDPLLVPRATSMPGGPQVSFVSQDLTRIFQAQGPSVAVQDFTQMRSCAQLGSSGGSCSTCAPACLELSSLRTALDASILAIAEETGTGRLFAAGGDQGLFLLAPQTNQPYAVSTVDPNVDPALKTQRWCTDVAISPDGTKLLATFGGQNKSQLRVYSMSNLSLPPIVYPLDASHGMVREGIAYSVVVRGNYAYVAMGKGGIVRVNHMLPPTGAWFTQGPPCEESSCNPTVPKGTVIRDLALVSNWLYAAADGYGLIEVNLSYPFSPTAYQPVLPIDSTCTSIVPPCLVPSNPTGNFGVRVDAVQDGTKIVIALATEAGSAYGAEWGPYRPYASFNWELGAPLLDPTLTCGDIGCGQRVFVFERPLTMPQPVKPMQRLMLQPTDSHFSNQSLDLARDSNGTYWILGLREELLAFTIGSQGSYTPLPLSNPGPYVLRAPSFAGGVLGIDDPSLVIFGEDSGGGGYGLPQLQGSGTSVSFAEILAPANNPTAFDFGLTLDSQWQSAQCGVNYEWVLGGGFNLRRFDRSASTPILTLEKFHFDFPNDSWAAAWAGDKNGRPYSCTVVDPRAGSDLVVGGRCGVPHGAVTYSQRELMLLTCAGTSPIAPTVQNELLTHPEFSSPPQQLDGKKSQTIGMKIFPLHDASASWILGVASGYNALDAAGQERPQLTFFDVTNCTNPSPSNPPAGPYVAFGAGKPGMFFHLDSAYINGKDYVFAADTGSRIVAFDVSNVLTTGAVQVASLLLPRNTFDGVRDLPVEVHWIAQPSGTTAGCLYVPVSRMGVARVKVDLNGSAMTLTLDQIANTPGQASGLAIRSVNGKRRMIVGDHEAGGVRAHGDY